MYWKLGLLANLGIMSAYFLISSTIFRGLIRTNQLRTNRLGLATAVIFASCGAGHGYHVAHLLLPAAGFEVDEGLAMRASFDWHLVAVDALTAAIAAWYWRLRTSYGIVLHGPVLFEDLKAKQRQALKLNDNVVQGLAVAKYALDAGDEDLAREAIQATLIRSRELVSDLLGAPDDVTGVAPGDLVRDAPALVTTASASRP